MSSSTEDRARVNADIFRKIAMVPVVSAGSVCKQGVSLVTTQVDVKNKSKACFTSSYVKTEDGWERVGAPTPASSVLKTARSKDGRRTARVVKKDSGEKKGVFFLEISDEQGLLLSFSTDGVDHGEIYTDGEFSCLSFSFDQNYLAYVAERKPEKERSFWDAPDGEGAPPASCNVYSYRMDWGEQYVGKRDPVVCVLDIARARAAPVRGLDKELSYGQAVWAHDDAGLIFTGWDAPHQRFGFIYCYNRPSHLFFLPREHVLPPPPKGDAEPDAPKAEAEEKCLTVCLTPEDHRARSPLVSSDGRRAFFLSTREVVTHNTCSALRYVDLPAGQPPVTVVDVVDVPEDSAAFPGLFLHSLSPHYLVDDGLLLLPTQWRSELALVAVDVGTGSVARVTPSGDSWRLLDVFAGRVLVTSENMARPPAVHVAAVADVRAGRLNAECILPSPPVPGINGEVISHIENLVPTDAPGRDYAAAQPFQAVVACLTESTGPRPVVVYPHGGPHGAYSNFYGVSPTFLVALGYVVVFVNYRGSTGFGRLPLESLCGRVGIDDVEDTQQAASWVLSGASPAGDVDSRRVYYFGGSHGGFIGAHVTLKYPDFYAAAVLHNPVVNFMTLYSTSDIGDWTFAVTGVPHRHPPTPEDARTLFAMSPIARDRALAKTPTLFKIGAKDLRVPPAQGLELHHALRKTGVPSEVLYFPDECHPIDAPHANASAWVQSVAWFEKHTRPPLA